MSIVVQFLLLKGYLMNRKSLAVIGVGNMAKAIINGIINVDFPLNSIFLYDVNEAQSTAVQAENVFYSLSLENAIKNADCVLLSVKPQNYDEVLEKILSVPKYKEKLYISIGAGISTDYVKEKLGMVAVVRVLPNVPIIIGKGVSVICRNNSVDDTDFSFVKDIFESAGSVIEIDEKQMNPIIGVTSSSPAYVFKFIEAICDGANIQGIDSPALKSAVCDMIIGSAMMLRDSDKTPTELVKTVASKGGTTERALLKLDEYDFSKAVIDAMIACTARADELGSKK